MAVLAECPTCHKKQSINNRQCDCGEDLIKAKKAKRVHFWISYRLPGGKQKRESVGYSIEEAKDADGKRRVQKRENTIFDIKPDSKMTFHELTNWFLDLEKVKSRAYYPTLNINLKNFNSTFGNIVIGNLKPIDLENYQAKRKSEGYSDSYIDHEISAARTMIHKAFDNDLVGGNTLKNFNKVKKLLKRNANARDKILSFKQYDKLITNAPTHIKPIIATGFYTGMRRGEILNLTWDKINLKNRMINLDAADTKDNEPRKIPISDPLYKILSAIPKAIHDDHVFLYKGKPLKEIRRSLKTACKASEITHGRFEKDGFIFHDLRHSFNTYMRKAGVAQSVIMKITGHSTNAMFNRYNTVDDEDASRAMNQMQEFFASVDQNVDQSNKKGVNETR